jgi:hypothetical protein
MIQKSEVYLQVGIWHLLLGQKLGRGKAEILVRDTGARVSGIYTPESPPKNPQQQQFMGVLSTIKHRMSNGCK